MNDDPATSSSSQPQGDDSTAPYDDDNESINRRERNRDGTAQPPASASAGRKLAQTQKKNDLLDHLLRSLDVLIYCELSAVYYMDCFFLCLLLRSLIQVFYLTPKPPGLPSMAGPSPSVGAIFGTNAICLFSHIFYASPSAGEATRGYMHGGLLTDFVGFKGPTSKFHLALLDILILTLQVCMLSVRVERHSLDTPVASSSHPTSRPENNGSSATQTYDAEERGVRTADSSGSPTDNIELQPLQPASHETQDIATQNAASPQPPNEEGSYDPLLQPSSEPPDQEDHALDAFLSGRVVIASLHLPRTVRNQWRAYEYRNVASAARTPSSSTDQTATEGGRSAARAAAVAWAGNRLGFQVRIGGRPLGS